MKKPSSSYTVVALAAIVTFLAASPALPTEASDAAYEKGAALAADGKLDEALAVFREAASRDPQNGSLAAALAAIRDADEGRVSAEVVKRMFRAMQHANAGRWAEADADADAAVGLAPDYVRAHSIKGRCYSCRAASTRRSRSSIG